METEQKETFIKAIFTALDLYDSEDSSKIQDAAVFYCSENNIIEGFKYAIRLSLDDDKSNLEDIDGGDIKYLLSKLI